MLTGHLRGIDQGMRARHPLGLVIVTEGGDFRLRGAAVEHGPARASLQKGLYTQIHISIFHKNQ